MRKQHWYIAAALLVSLFIYLFYRTGHTLVNEIAAYLLTPPRYAHWRELVIAALPLPDIIVYSLPEGLWVFSITLTSRHLYLRMGAKRMHAVLVPLLFAGGLEVLQWLHVTNGRFDWLDLLATAGGWLAGYLLVPCQEEQVLLFDAGKLRRRLCIASYAIVYLAHVFA